MVSSPSILIKNGNLPQSFDEKFWTKEFDSAWKEGKTVANK